MRALDRHHRLLLHRAAAQDRHRRLAADALGVEQPDQVVGALDGDAVDRQDQVARQHPGLRRRSARRDLPHAVPPLARSGRHPDPPRHGHGLGVCRPPAARPGGPPGSPPGRRGRSVSGSSPSRRASGWRPWAKETRTRPFPPGPRPPTTWLLVSTSPSPGITTPEPTPPPACPLPSGNRSTRTTAGPTLSTTEVTARE